MSGYEEWVSRVADAIHETCRNEWRAILIVDPKRQFTQHGTEAHYGMAHDLVRRLNLAAEPRWPGGEVAELELAMALRRDRYVAHVGQRYGSFNDAYYETRAAEILAALQEKRDPGE